MITVADGIEYFGCSAALVAPDWVLTNHTCIGELTPDQLRIMVGAKSLTTSPADIAVDRVVDPGGDLRLLHLVAYLDDVPVLPIATTTPPDGTSAHTYVYFLGAHSGGPLQTLTESTTSTSCAATNGGHAQVCAQASAGSLDWEKGSPLVADLPDGPALVGMLWVPGHGGRDEFIATASYLDGLRTVMGSLAAYGTPSTPANFSVQPTSAYGTFAAQWDASDDGGWPLSSYDLVVHTDWQINGQWVAQDPYQASYPPSVTSTAIDYPQVAYTVRYSFVLRARNALGTSADSPVLGPFLVAPHVAPGPPQNVAVTFGPASVTVRWDAPANLGSGVVGYNIHLTTPGGTQSLGNIYAGANERQATIAADPGSVFVHVSAFGKISSSAEWVVSGVVGTGSAPPAAPENVNADLTAPPGTGAVTWDRDPTDQTPITGWEVRWWHPWQGLVADQQLGAAARATETTLPPGPYWVFVRPLSASGVGFMGLTMVEVAAGAALPTAPRQMAVTGGRGQATVSWVPGPGGIAGAAVTGFRVTAYPVWPSIVAPVTTIVGADARQARLVLRNAGQWHFTVRAMSAMGLGPQARHGAVTVSKNKRWALVSMVSTREGNSGMRTVSIPVRAVINSIGAVQIPWYTELSGTATPGVDYQSVTGTIALPANGMSRRVRVQIIGDTMPEPDEYFYVVFQPPPGVSLATDRVKVVIVNDD